MLAVPSLRAAILSGVDWPTRWGLVEHWRLDEGAVGSAIASVNQQNNLTDNNTVTSNPGKVYPTARQFTFANSEYLSLADNAALSTGAVDFWVAAWCYLDSASNNTFRLIASKEDDGTHREFSFYRDGGGGNAFKLGVFNAAGTAIGSVLSTAGAPTAGAWHLVLGYYDTVNNLVKISVDGGAFDSGAVTGTPADTTASFRIGATGSTPSLFWDGRIGPVAFGKSPPSGIAALAAEIRDRLYNNGAGRAYPWR